MTPRLDGKIAMVTGAAQGLGEEMALAFAADGADVAGFDIRPEQLEAVGDRIRAQGRRFQGIEVDVRDSEEVEHAVATVYDELGPVDFLVNNAGKGQRQTFVEITPELWQYMLDINLTSQYNLCRAVVPRMLERGSGRIVNISSIAANRGARLLGKSAYAAAKGGVLAFTKALAVELAPHKITVNCIIPGVHNTPRRAQDTPEETARLLPQIPMGEYGDPADLAQAVIFFCLPSSRYTTGVLLPVDGGHSI